MCGMLIQLNKEYLPLGECFYSFSSPLSSETNMHCVTANLSMYDMQTNLEPCRLCKLLTSQAGNSQWFL